MDSDFLRRTPLAPALPAGLWTALDDVAVLARTGDPQAARPLVIADLSPLRRVGFKGRDTLAVMKARGVVMEAEPNRAFRQADGGLCLVLGAGEVFLLASLDAPDGTLQRLESMWRIEDEARTYVMPRRDSHAWLAVAGPSAPAMFAKLCAVDLRPGRFADLAVAQTSVARLNAIVVRADRDGRAVYHLLADSAASAYLLSCVLDAAQEFNGALVGLEDLRSDPTPST